MAFVRTRFGRSLVGLAGLAILVSACAGKKNVVPTGTLQADKFLFDKGTEALNNRKWLAAREYFRQIVENYPQSGYRPDAKLGLGDTYIGENSAESLVLAQNEFKEFLTFYPTNARADYAQYKMGLTHYRQMLAPDRDQTETKEAIAEWKLFLERYPNSQLIGEVRAKLREAQDRLSESEYRVGLFYFRSRWYPGAIDRFKSVLASDPEYTGRDAVYFYLAGSLVKVGRPAEALPYYERLVKEFEKSEHVAEARLEIEALKKAAADKDKK